MLTTPVPNPFDPTADHSGPISPLIDLELHPEGFTLGVRGSRITIPAGMAKDVANRILFLLDSTPQEG